MKNGKIQIYCGDGKGKTTASVGLGVRAFGNGMRVLFAQFLKDNKSSELNVISRLGDDFVVLSGTAVEKFIFQMSDEEKQETSRAQTEKLCKAISLCKGGEFDVVILDEIFGAIETGMVPENEVREFLINKPKGVEVVLTGRNPSEGIIALADYVSEIKAVKHPFESGLEARKGIEF